MGLPQVTTWWQSVFRSRFATPARVLRCEIGNAYKMFQHFVERGGTRCVFALTIFPDLTMAKVIDRYNKVSVAATIPITLPLSVGIPAGLRGMILWAAVSTACFNCCHVTRGRGRVGSSSGSSEGGGSIAKVASGCSRQWMSKSRENGVDRGERSVFHDDEPSSGAWGSLRWE